MFLQKLRLFIISLCLLSMNTFAKVESSFRFIENDRVDFIHVEARGNDVNLLHCKDENNCDEIAQFSRTDLDAYVKSSKRGNRLQHGLNITASLSFSAAAFILYFTITSSESDIPIQLLAVPVFGAISAISAVCAVGTKLVRRRSSDNRLTARRIDDNLMSCDLEQTEVSNLDEMIQGILELEKALGK